MQVWRIAHHNFFLTVLLLFQLLESSGLFCAMALPVVSREVTVGSCHLSCEAPSSLSCSPCQCFPYQSGLLFQCSSLLPSWQMVHSSAEATAKSDLWRCDSTVKIFQHCCSEKLQWQEVTVKNSIMYLEAFIHPSLNTELEGTTVPISANLHYPSIMNFCCIKANMLHSDLPSWNSYKVVEIFNSHWNHTWLRSCMVRKWANSVGLSSGASAHCQPCTQSSCTKEKSKSSAAGWTVWVWWQHLSSTATWALPAHGWLTADLGT